jgi:hypothetical protein
MNPMFQAALGAILRHFLTIIAGGLVARGIWTQEEAATYVGAAVLAALGLGWSLWAKYRDRLFRDQAMAMPAGVTEDQVKSAMARRRPVRRR